MSDYEHTTNGVPYTYGLCADGGLFTILINKDDPDNIPSEEQIQEAWDELIRTRDVVTICVVEEKDGGYKTVKQRQVNERILSGRGGVSYHWRV